MFTLTQCASIAAHGQVALPGGPCLIEAHQSWSDVEKWVWNRLCVGEVADLGERDGRSLDPGSTEGWEDGRLLSPRFLESILFHEPWASAIPRQGVRIIGALFDAPIDLTGGRIQNELWLDRSRFEGPLHLRDIETRGLVSFINSHFSDELNMNRATIGGNLLMRGGAEFADVDLLGANIAGQLDMTDAKVSGTLVMAQATIGSTLFIREGNFGKDINGVFVRIDGNLDLRGAELSGLDLTGAHIEGELRLASPDYEPTWQDDARLILRNVAVDALQETPNAWPQELDLDGFVYRTLGGLEGNINVAARGSESYESWLARDEPYTPQPYEQLASVLRRMGHGEEANDILYAGQERARALTFKDGHYLSWAGQTMLKYSIGYGFGRRYFRSFFWVIGLVVIGTLVLRRSGQYKVPAQDGKPMEIGLSYSLDMLLPIIRLRGRHYDVDLQGLVRYYFYFHQIMGYVLASFLIAGLSGLTK